MTIAMIARAAPALVACWMLAAGAVAQTPPAPAEPAPATQAAPSAAPAAPAAEPASPLAPLAWLDGCWRGAVNKREFREHWTPMRGDMMVGVSHTVMADKTLDYEYLRLEVRPDGVYYVTFVPGKPEAAYKYTGTTTDKADTIYSFVNPAVEFPRKISYRQGIEGWLYATVEGKVAGADRSVIYPMRRIGCESGELIKK